MKEPKRIKLNPSAPSQKDVTKIPMPAAYKPEWDIARHTNDDIYTPIDLERIDEFLDKDNNENNHEDNS